ncbi:MAG: NTP transferase domain-containing protein, partial [Bdellovibrionales bacterium]
MSELSVIILAAGKGTRMNSPLPKVVHPVAGRPMIERVVSAATGAKATDIRVIVGFGESLVRQIVEPLGATCFKQDRQNGTADAVRSAQVENLEGDVLILN